MTKLSIFANNDMSEDKPRCSNDDLFVVLYNVETNLKLQVIIPQPGTLDKLTLQLNSSDQNACNQPANINDAAQSAKPYSRSTVGPCRQIRCDQPANSFNGFNIDRLFKIESQ